jgi:DNA helicase-2/ATP-dependent DNA helicase PcrA
MGHEALLEGLSDEQRAAVLHEGGPLAVLAGPGTGKTKLIVHRIADLIVRRGADPSSILALTYTVKAAAQLRERLAALLSELSERGVRVPEAAADAVTVATYHGFGRRLTLRFADFLGLSSRPRLLDEAEHLRLVREVIVREGLVPSINALGVEAAARRVIEAIGELGDRAIDPGAALAVLETDRARLGASGVLAREVIEAARVVMAHQRRAGVVTFNELLTLPIELLRGDGLAAQIIRQDYRSAVVDEFQDVNAATIVLLSRLFPGGRDGAGPELGRGPELCVVGDDDQAIYAFRGADDRAFARFAALWPRHTEVRLSENFRSSPAVLRAAVSVIARATRRYRPDKVLVAGAGSAARGLGGAGVELVEVTGVASENAVVAAWLLAARQAEPARGWSSYAVIARSHAELARTSEALALEGIPVHIARRASFADDPGAAALLAWCRGLCDGGDPLHARVILGRAPLLADGATLLSLETRYARRVRAFRQACEDAGGAGQGSLGVADPGPLVPWACAQPELAGPSAERVAGLYRRLAARRASARADELIYELAVETDVVHDELMPAAQRATRLAAVVRLLRFARLRQERLAPPGDLASFVAYLDELDPDGRGIDDGEGDRVDGDGAGVEPVSSGAAGAVEGDGAVTLITAHSAKGLEFDSVIVQGVSPAAGRFPSPPRADEAGFGAQVLAAIERASGPGAGGPGGSVTGDGRADDGAAVDEVRARVQAEERRLFYVACTRAKRRLVVVGKLSKAALKDVGKAGRPVNYLAELLADKALGARVRDDADVITQAPGPHSGVVRELERAAERRARTDELRALVLRARAEVAGALDAACAAAAGGEADAGSGAGAETGARAGKGGPPDVNADDVHRRLAEVGRRARFAAALEAVCASGQVPAWAQGPGESSLSDADLARLRDAGGVYRGTRGGLRGDGAGEGRRGDAEDGGDADNGDGGGGLVWPELAARFPVDGALRRLSYTTISEYLRCPACWFCKYAMGHQELPGPALEVGTIVHGVLAGFFRRVRDAERDGVAAPGLEELLAMGRRAVLAEAGGGPLGIGRSAQEIDEVTLRVTALLRAAHAQHDWSANLTDMIEFTPAPLPVVTVDGVAYPLECKLDRVDTIETREGVRWRILDFKTGAPKADLLRPAKGDLQLGIYKLGLAAAIGTLGDQGPSGEARYVLLAAGPSDRAKYDKLIAPDGKGKGPRAVGIGAIDLDDLDTGLIQERIEEFVRGVRAGRFPRGGGCKGRVCGLLEARAAHGAG